MGSLDATCSVPRGIKRSCYSGASVRTIGGPVKSGTGSALDPIPIVCLFNPEDLVTESKDHPIGDKGGHEREIEIIESDGCEYLRDILSDEQISRAKELAVRLCRSEYGPVDHFINYITADPLERKAVQTIITHCRTVMEIDTAVRIHEVFNKSEPGFIIRFHGTDCGLCKQFEGCEYRLSDHDLRCPPFCLGCRCRLSMVPLPKLERGRER